MENGNFSNRQKIEWGPEHHRSDEEHTDETDDDRPEEPQVYGD